MNIFRISLVLAVFGILAMLILLPNLNHPQLDTKDSGKLQVAVSFFVIEDVVRAVGGDEINVVVRPAPGVDVHSFEPTAREIQAIYSSDIFFTYGAGIDAWAGRISDELKETGVTVINLSDYLTLQNLDGVVAVDNDLVGSVDPHAWLDPVQVITMTETIAETMASVDPKHADIYQVNAENYISSLEELNSDFNDGLGICETRNIIVAHNAFNYLANRYNFTAFAIAGVSPDSEPSPKVMSQLTIKAQELGVSTIFFESLSSPKLSETIAQELSLQTMILNPVEGLTVEQQAAGMTYVDVMRDNLANLRVAMSCQ
ncbi:MAG: hypothetical protein COW24_02590 [Candidatus Kerfeldbacteria bacterium CG15_BIG_FIL_POST_REV_8_21_14_020_45_12]|uniref:ABC transporter substrate-binding protein n=1 Tax=Candidatus Kerfeldbacteria bacterium CG15_BIG_FIL_POST_REV_8_21_14_020_45_12 TaxID=2014247 RepID=A0A2M7H420_9BACT|nr:MAG: hypothetical protein COW24_02590 [Candidatus Kerfeldbacteria bacterium CG15_BIG_FIL_POST_REV_8_21_14_020_45_12]PJA93886.1 MAG: hypothetical protein CO132_00855 [Candidatus Kerfeldbacteria bacterium CG_4_9_14_3_um_filter_45_8]